MSRFGNSTEWRKRYIESIYPLTVRELTAGVIRITDGERRLDLYQTRYFMVDIGKRGDLPISIDDVSELIEEYFNLL